MTPRSGMHRARALAAAVLLAGAAAGSAAALPANAAPAAAAPIQAAPATSCEVTGGTLTWGVKESFRSYISSSIANGEWKASKGASYQTPSFTFSNGHGSYDAATGTGSVSFDGSVRFTGHEGVLDLTFANPTVEFDGTGGARLLLDAKSNDQEGKQAIDQKQVPVGKIAGGPIQKYAGDDPTLLTSLEMTDTEVMLTAEGAKAFAGFYPSGDALDPITLAVQTKPCTGGTAQPGDGSTPEPEQPGTEAGGAGTGSAEASGGIP